MDPISEHSVVTTNLKTIVAVVAFVLVAGSLYWANRNDIAHLQERVKALESKVDYHDRDIQRLEVELAKLAAKR